MSIVRVPVEGRLCNFTNWHQNCQVVECRCYFKPIQRMNELLRGSSNSLYRFPWFSQREVKLSQEKCSVLYTMSLVLSMVHVWICCLQTLWRRLPHHSTKSNHQTPMALMKRTAESICKQCRNDEVKFFRSVAAYPLTELVSSVKPPKKRSRRYIHLHRTFSQPQTLPVGGHFFVGILKS